MDTSEIKKKFLDILFEVEEPQKTEPVSKSQKVLSAKDILYNKSQPLDLDLPKTKAAFIDFDKPKEKPIEPVFTQPVEPKPIPEKKNEYVFMSNVSPMFGLLDDEEKDFNKVNYNINNENNRTQSKQTNYLGTVISPFYGYDFPKVDEKVQENVQPVNNLTNTIKKRELERPFPEAHKNVSYITPSFSDESLNKTPINNQPVNNQAPVYNYYQAQNNVPQYQANKQVVQNNIPSQTAYTKPIYQEYTDETRTEEIDLFEDLFGDKD